MSEHEQPAMGAVTRASNGVRQSRQESQERQPCDETCVPSSTSKSKNNGKSRSNTSQRHPNTVKLVLSQPFQGLSQSSSAEAVMTGPELRAQQAHAEEIATPCGLCGAGIRDKANKVLLDASNITARSMAKTLAQHQREEHRGQGQAFMDVMRHHNARLCTYGLCTTCGDLASSLFQKGTTCSRCVKARQVAEAQEQPLAETDSAGTGKYAAIMRRAQQIPDFEAQRQAKRAANEAAAATTAQAAAAAAAITAQAAAAAQQQAAAAQQQAEAETEAEEQALQAQQAEMARQALEALQPQIAEAEAIEQRRRDLKTASAALSRLERELAGTDLTAAVQDNRPGWTAETPAVAAVLDSVTNELLETSVFFTVKDPSKRRQKDKWGQRRLTDKAARLYAHALKMHSDAVDQPVSDEQQLQLRRTTVLLWLMGALISSSAVSNSRAVRLALLWAGDFKALVQQLTASALLPLTRSGKQKNDKELRNEAIRLMGERGGMKVLLNRMQQRGSSTADDQCWADMQAKHPAAPQGESQAELQQIVADLKAEIGERVPDAEERERRQKSYDPADIIQEIQRHNPFSSAGPGGLKYSHLQAYLSTKWGRERIPEGLSRLFKQMQWKKSSLSPLFWRLIGGARLVAIASELPDGGVKNRPVAVGEVLSRMSGALLLKAVSPALAAILVPAGQHAVGLESGTDRDALAATLNHQMGCSTLLCDIRNAYNCVSRKAVLRAVATHLPDALDLIAAQLADHQGTLLFRHQDGSLRRLKAETGVPQGHPLSSAEFAMVLHAPIMRFTERAVALGLPMRLSFFADDGKILNGAPGFSAPLLDGLQVFTDDLETVGLQMAPHKLIALPGRGEVVSEADMARLQQYGIPMAGGAQDDVTRGAQVVGVAVGNEGYQQQQIRKLMAPDGDIRRLADGLIALKSPRALLQLATKGLVTKMSYAARTTDPDVAREVYTEFDQLPAYLIAKSMGVIGADVSYELYRDGEAGADVPGKLNAVTVAQMQLPSRLGGFGLRSVAGMADAAYAGGMSAAMPGVLQNFTAVYPDREQMLTNGTLQQLPVVQAFIQALSRISTEIGQAMALTVDSVHTDMLAYLQSVAAEPEADHVLDLTGMMLQGPLQGTQGVLTKLIDKQKSSNLMATFTDDENRARYHSMTVPGSICNSWQHVAMTSDTLFFDGPVVALTMQRILGIERRTPVCFRCNAVGGGTVHACFCRAPGIAGHRSRLHNRLERKLAVLATTATGITPSTESTAPFVGIADDRRMDIVCDPDSFPVSALTKPLFGKSLMIDLSTVTVRSAAHRQLAAHDVAQILRAREGVKQAHYGGTYNSNSHALLTFAVSTFGALGEEAKQIIDALVTEQVARSGFVAEGVIMADAVSRLKSSVVAHHRGHLSIALHTGISARVLEYLTAPTEEVGGVEVQAVEQPGDVE